MVLPLYRSRISTAFVFVVKWLYSDKYRQDCLQIENSLLQLGYQKAVYGITNLKTMMKCGEQ